MPIPDLEAGRPVVDEDSKPRAGSSDDGLTEAASPPLADAPEDRPRAHNYRVLERLGEGGMGQVFVAEQLRPVRRRVALKVIKRGMDSREIIARFESERQALALMNHPAIAKVLDAGVTERGRPYFAMEYISGLPITEYCSRHRLSTHARLRLFLKVCDGVHHAHQKAIIHRDLKPSNVLVAGEDDAAYPKIIDFGVAKAIGRNLIDQTLHTSLGQPVGTLEYMSPEQAEMGVEDIDIRSDIYSLGVLLYQLLVGAQPFHRQSLPSSAIDDVRRHIREVDPQKPSTRVTSLQQAPEGQARRTDTEASVLKRELEGDLDWIVMRAMAKERERRYQSANELASDLRRHLTHEPVSASPPSVIYRLGKLYRRRRNAFLAAGIASAAVLSGLAFATYGFVAASRERDEKIAALGQAEEVTEFLTAMLSAVDPERQGRDVTVRQMLDEAALGVEDRFSGQPRVEGRLRQTIGDSYLALGLLDKAERHLTAAAALSRRELGAEHEQAIASRRHLASLYYAQGRFEESETLIDETLAQARQSLGDDHAEVRHLTFDLATVYFQQARYEEAATQFAHVGEVRRRLLGDEHEETLLADFNLATAYWAQGRMAEAEPLFSRVLEARRRVLGHEHPETLDSLNNLAALYHLQHRYTEAEPLYVEALEGSRSVRGPEHPETLVTMGNLAELYLDEGRVPEAEGLLVTTVETKSRVLGEDHPSTLYSRTILAELYRRSDRSQQARRVYEQLLPARRRLSGEQHPDTIAATAGLQKVYVALGDPRARPLLRQLLELKALRASGDEASPRALADYAELLLTCEPPDLRDPVAALDYAERANQLTGFSDPSYLATLALAQFEAGNGLEALDTQEAALARLPAESADRDLFRQKLEEYRASLDAASQP